MKLLLLLVVQLLSLLNFRVVASTTTPSAFVTTTTLAAQKSKESPTTVVSKMASVDPGINFCDLPGDPSLILTTNVDLGDKKMEIMKACSKAIESATGKPEAYIGTYRACLGNK